MIKSFFLDFSLQNQNQNIGFAEFKMGHTPSTVRERTANTLTQAKTKHLAKYLFRENG